MEKIVNCSLLKGLGVAGNLWLSGNNRSQVTLVYLCSWQNANAF